MNRAVKHNGVPDRSRLREWCGRIALIGLLIASCGARAGVYPPEYRDFSGTASAKVVMLGTGMPLPDPKRRGPAVAIVVGGRSYLFDAGEGVWRGAGAMTPYYGGPFPELAAAKLNIVFLTHLHTDHTVGLPSLMLSPWTMGRKSPIDVYGPPGTERLVTHLTEAYYRDIVARQMDPSQHNGTGWVARPHEFGEPGLVYQDENIRVEAFRVVHHTDPHTFGFKVTAGGRVIVISGDCRPSPELIEAARGADVLLHEAIGSKDRDKQPWGKSANLRLDFGEVDVAGLFHTTTKQLAEIAGTAKPGVLVLYHEQNWSDPFDPDRLAKEVAEFGYKGRVISARDGDIF